MPLGLWAMAINSLARCAWANLSTGLRASGGVEMVGRSADESKTDLGVCGAPEARPERVEGRLAFAAVCWHLGLQNLWGRAPLRAAGCGNSVAHWAQVRVALTMARFLVNRERAPGVVTKSPLKWVEVVGSLTRRDAAQSSRSRKNRHPLKSRRGCHAERPSS
jgi:hypothetical protein